MRVPAEIADDARSRRRTHLSALVGIGKILNRAIEAAGIVGRVQDSLAAVFDEAR